MANPSFNLIAERNDDIQKDVVGLTIELMIREDGDAVDISTATTKNIIIQKPDLTSGSRSGSFVTDGTDGLLKYTTVSGDLDQAGNYYVQSYLVMPGFSGCSTIVAFIVNDNL